jgi:hypothetical protein
MVRAKFTVTSIESNGAADSDNMGSTITLLPVTGGSKENDNFYRWTPGGSIVLSTINPEAAIQFEPGKTFYVDFTLAE